MLAVKTFFQLLNGVGMQISDIVEKGNADPKGQIIKLYSIFKVILDSEHPFISVDFDHWIHVAKLAFMNVENCDDEHINDYLTYFYEELFDNSPENVFIQKANQAKNLLIEECENWNDEFVEPEEGELDLDVFARVLALSVFHAIDAGFVEMDIEEQKVILKEIYGMMDDFLIIQPGLIEAINIVYLLKLFTENYDHLSPEFYEQLPDEFKGIDNADIEDYYCQIMIDMLRDIRDNAIVNLENYEIMRNKLKECVREGEWVEL